MNYTLNLHNLLQHTTVRDYCVTYACHQDNLKWEVKADACVCYDTFALKSIDSTIPIEMNRCCENTYQIQSKKVKVNQTESNKTTILKQESLTCPSEQLSRQSRSNSNIENPKTCEFGTFQDYRISHGATKMVSLNENKSQVFVNRTWLELPDLRIPIHSNTYCVSKSIFDGTEFSYLSQSWLI